LIQIKLASDSDQAWYPPGSFSRRSVCFSVQIIGQRHSRDIARDGVVALRADDREGVAAVVDMEA
jgi:hypothetical protein